VIWQMLDICRHERVGIWHGHDYKSNLLGLLLRCFWPMRLVTTVHGWVRHTRRTPLYYGIDRVCLPRYEVVICVSEDLRQCCLKCGVSPKRCVLIENAIDTVEFSRRLPVEEAKAQLGLHSGRFVIGSVGRLSAEKGYDVLIRAVDQLIRAGLNIELLIAGEGDEKSRLETLISELGLGQFVRLLGYRADTRELYEALDLYVLSSYREGLPNVLLEAMALEVPVVATRIAGVPRLVRHQETGLLVEPGDVEGLAAAITHLFENPSDRARLAASGRQRVERDYSFAVRMDRIRSLYDELLGVQRLAAPEEADL
jgi:glycosyltransferase involved in cell wall biosynthesis